MFGARALRLEIEGDQAFEVPVAEGSRHYTASAETVAFDLVPAGWLPNGQLTVRGLSVAGEDASEAFGVSALDVTSTGDPALAVGPEAPTWAVSVEAEGVRLPQQDAAPLGSDIDRVALDAKLLGALRPDPWPSSLGRWRDQGGVVEATRLDIDYGSLKLEGEGTFALDKRGQPIGAMTTRIQGFEPTLDQLATTGVIPSHVAATAKILLRALARTEDEGDDDPGGSSSVLQDRMISIGPVPLLRVPEVRWLSVSPSRDAADRFPAVKTARVIDIDDRRRATAMMRHGAARVRGRLLSVDRSAGATLGAGGTGLRDVAANSSLAGGFLVASPKMADPRFARTVILVVSHDRDGAMGLVINRSIRYRLAEISAEGLWRR